MRFLLKLKIEIYIILFLILAIVVFFIYGKVRDVMMTEFVEQQAAAIQEMVTNGDAVVEELRGIKEELAKLNVGVIVAE